MIRVSSSQVATSVIQTPPNSGAAKAFVKALLETFWPQKSGEKRVQLHDTYCKNQSEIGSLASISERVCLNTFGRGKKTNQKSYVMEISFCYACQSLLVCIDRGVFRSVCHKLLGNVSHQGVIAEPELVLRMQAGPYIFLHVLDIS